MISEMPEYLGRDRLNHIDMLEALRRGIGELLFADEEGAVVLCRGETCMLSAASAAALERMLARIGDKPPVICAHQVHFVPLLQDKFAYQGTIECLQYAYLSPEKPEEAPAEGVELRALTMENLDFVSDNYEHGTRRAYVAERIAAGMLGVWYRGKPAGFAGTHTEGTIGLLHVLPEFRRLGLAYTLEAAMIGRELALGHVPHGHVLTDNSASIRLQEKIGMRISDKGLVWLFDD